jgi:hypothetical protein
MVMEINAITVADWAEKMNKNTVNCLNANRVASSSTWVGFAGPYDAVRNQIEVTYDNGKGSVIRATFFQLQGNDTITARAAIESIMHKSARMNITNMRRHCFIDCMEFAERDHVEEKKQYWYFREHAKEHAWMRCGKPWMYGTSDDIWGNHLSAGLSRAFDVGEKRQKRVGVSDAETVAHAALSKRLDTARNTIELLDSTQSELIAAGNACDNVFNTVKVNYDNVCASCYMNPYNNCMFAKIPCCATFKLNEDKCNYANVKYVCDSTCIIVNYDLVYDEQFDTVTASNMSYAFGYYMSSISMEIDDSMNITVDITHMTEKSQAFKNDEEVTVAGLKERVLDVVTNRINKMIAAKAAIK